MLGFSCSLHLQLANLNAFQGSSVKSAAVLNYDHQQRMLAGFVPQLGACILPGQGVEEGAVHCLSCWASFLQQSYSHAAVQQWKHCGSVMHHACL